MAMDPLTTIQLARAGQPQFSSTANKPIDPNLRAPRVISAEMRPEETGSQAGLANLAGAVGLGLGGGDSLIDLFAGNLEAGEAAAKGFQLGSTFGGVPGGMAVGGAAAGGAVMQDLAENIAGDAGKKSLTLTSFLSNPNPLTLLQASGLFGSRNLREKQRNKVRDELNRRLGSGIQTRTGRGVTLGDVLQEPEGEMQNLALSLANPLALALAADRKELREDAGALIANAALKGAKTKDDVLFNTIQLAKSLNLTPDKAREGIKKAVDAGQFDPQGAHTLAIELKRLTNADDATHQADLRNFLGDNYKDLIANNYQAPEVPGLGPSKDSNINPGQAPKIDLELLRRSLSTMR